MQCRMAQVRLEIRESGEETSKDASDATGVRYGSRMLKTPELPLGHTSIRHGDERPNIREQLPCPCRLRPAIHLEVSEQVKVAALEEQALASDRGNDAKTAITDHRFDAVFQVFGQRGERHIPSCTILMLVTNHRWRHDGPVSAHRTQEEEIDRRFRSSNPIPDGVGNCNEWTALWDALLPGCTG